MRAVRFGAVAVLSICAFTARAQSTEPPDGKNYIEKSFSPEAIAAAGLGAGITQGTNAPSEWGQGAEGFGKRFGSAIAKHLVKRAIQYPVAKFFHEELSYRRSDKTGFGPRLEHALVSTVYTHKTTDGKRTVAKGEIVGAFGSGLISRLWQPASTRTIGLGFASGGITLGADAAGNVIREFWPEIRHPHTHGVSENKTGAPGAKAAFPSAIPANHEGR